MTGRLFLHIGPPKTGTTSLQIAFEKLKHPQFKYLGVLQPRNPNADSLAELLHADLGGGPTGYCSIERVKEFVTSGHVALLSEEMLSLAQDDLSTADKISLLGRAFRDIPVTVLITLRNPIEALPSLYQQLHPNLPLGMSFERFCKSPFSNCFDYGYLAIHLIDAGFADLKWLSFEAIGESRLDTAELFGESDLWNRAVLATPKTNIGAKSENSSARALKPVTLKNIGRARVLRISIDRLGLRGNPLMKKVSEILNKIPVRRAKFAELVVPEARRKELLNGYNNVLNATYGQRLPRNDDKTGFV